MAITQLIFDLDGTLVDSFPGIAFSASAALAQTLPGRKAPDFMPFIGPPIREIFRRALPKLSAWPVRGLVTTWYSREPHWNSAANSGLFPCMAEVMSLMIRSSCMLRCDRNSGM